MNKLSDIIKSASAVLGGFLGWFLGGADGFLYALVVFVALDYLTGVMCAVFDKKLSSEVGFRGICKKVLIFLLVGMGNVLDLYILKNGAVIRTAVIFFYTANEGISLLENAGRLGLPVPKKILGALEQLKKKGEDDDDEGD